ncbi:hypothetical protein B0J15DRAFT_506251 [Fusarium solani]|uniref:Uncharacterized protein n=1 Tax=Fusarium solani TaxID=169388 RepID=A0A9P9G1D8_FUSSL|nr:uncharacterized protein B0J15DRAFT_506251 [Fusarium solani]KAH7230731.1 hypothetical protein B0J15DRAFT_506251 [Fusarium solani]
MKMMKESIDAADPSNAQPQDESDPEFSLAGPKSLVAVKKGTRWTQCDSPRLRNNLLGAVGFLELANAGDFAANVWNDTPVPVHAVVLMAIGGFTALVFSVFAFIDSRRAWANISFLHSQRKLLEDEKARRVTDSRPTQEIDVLLEITIRELRIEIINRWAMDVLLGGGAVLIGTGTFMAIGGANRRVWLASNILSGYLGNAPIAAFGLISATWAVIVWKKMRHHRLAAEKALKGAPALSLIKRRCFNLQLFYVINGIATILGGVGSMLTAERWWGYVILIPVIMSSLFCNVWWRKRVGYDRPWIADPAPMNTNGLVHALESTAQIRRAFQNGPGTILPRIVGGLPSPAFPEVLDFLVKHDLFETFCLYLINNVHVAHVLGLQKSTRVELDVSRIVEIPDIHHPRMVGLAEEFLREEGARHFQTRERFMIEILGTHLILTEKDQEIQAEK